MNKKKEVLIMAFSLDSKVKDILKNPAAAAVLHLSGKAYRFCGKSREDLPQ